jgi:hypothetical protein
MTKKTEKIHEQDSTTTQEQNTELEKELIDEDIIKQVQEFDNNIFIEQSVKKRFLTKQQIHQIINSIAVK